MTFSCLDWQACISEVQFQGREIRAKQPISVREGATLAEIMDLFHQADESMDSREMGHRLLQKSWKPTRNHCEEDKPPLFGLKEMSTQIIDDDCESSTLLAKIAKKTSLAFHQSMRMQARLSGPGRSAGEALREACAGWSVFKNFTPKSWDLMAQIFDRGNTMLEKGHLRIMSTIGLATSASASEVAKDPRNLSGHCFNVGYIKTPSMKECKCILLEGTAAMIMLPVTDASTRFVVDIFEDNKKMGQQVMDLPSLLSPLGGTVMMLSQIINSPNGVGFPEKGGWPFHCKVTGWLGRTMVMGSLDSDEKYPLRFYNRILFTGWSCTSSGQGCMPVKEDHDTTVRRGKTGGVMGCHPYDLNDMKLRGLSADLSADENKLMADIMEETTAPMVDPRVLQQISNFWVPCLPIECINQRKKGLHAEGMSYVRVAVMETPGVPEFIPLVLEAKGQLMSMTNAINSARPDSDGIVCSVCALGTGVHVLIDVPDYASPRSGTSKSSVAESAPADTATPVPRKLTFIDSMKQAMVKIGWPGAGKILLEQQS